MNKIEEILDNLLTESPELLKKKNDLRKVLLSMEQSNPDIKIDSQFKKILKNKLEVISYTKLSNTKNKKTNLAAKGVFSVKKDNANIFGKPKFNFFKIVSPLFIGAFAVFGIFHFFGDNLFTIQSGGDMEYKVQKISEDNAELKVSEVGENLEINNQDFSLDENGLSSEDRDEILNDGEAEPAITKSLAEEKAERKSFIQERIEKRNKEKSLQREKKKNIINEASNSLELSTQNVLDVNKQELVEEDNDTSITDKSTINTKSIADIDVTGVEDTQIIEALQNGEPEVEEASVNSLYEEPTFENLEIKGQSGEESIDNTYAEEEDLDLLKGLLGEEYSGGITSSFEDFCKTQGGEIKENVCEYGKKTCSREDFITNTCEKK